MSPERARLRRGNCLRSVSARRKPRCCSRNGPPRRTSNRSPDGPSSRTWIAPEARSGPRVFRSRWRPSRPGLSRPSTSYIPPPRPRSNRINHSPRQCGRVRFRFHNLSFCELDFLRDSVTYRNEKLHCQAAANVTTRTGVGLKLFAGLRICGQLEITARQSISAARSM
jgi:hypothetical protein